MVIEAGQPEILRAAQRDYAFQRELSEDLSQIVSAVFGLRKWIRWKQNIEDGAKFIYQGLTTLANLQTLGEEYTGIIHWTSERKLPTKYSQILMILFNCFGERFVLNVIGRFEQMLIQLPCQGPEAKIRPEAKNSLLLFCDYFKRLLPFIVKFHQTVFYFDGKYHQVSKRVTGIQYALVRFWLRDRSVTATFRILGLVSAIHLIVTMFVSLRKTEPVKTESSTTVSKVAAKCALCLNPRTKTTCTPCGHLFCWDCIVPWVFEKPFCPLCRQDVQPSRVILLQNYEK